jgi:hypothetical protein
LITNRVLSRATLWKRRSRPRCIGGISFSETSKGKKSHQIGAIPAAPCACSFYRLDEVQELRAFWQGESFGADFRFFNATSGGIP